MFSQLPSQPTIVKLSRDHVTRPSNCGTHSLSANTQFKKTATPTGSHAFASRPIKSIQLSSAAAGIAPSKCGILPTANWSWIIMDTTDIWTPLLFRLMDRSAHPVERTARLCCGIWMTESTCTPWTTMTSSTPCASHQTATGCVSLTGHQSKSGTWHARRWLRNFVQASLEPTHRRPIHHNACRSLGRLTVKLCSLATVTTRFVCGKCQSLPAKFANSMHLSI